MMGEMNQPEKNSHCTLIYEPWENKQKQHPAASMSCQHFKDNERPPATYKEAHLSELVKFK